MVTSDTFWRQDGEGTALFLLHGVGLDHRMWDPVAALLAEGFRVLRLDMPGHGRTPRAGAPLTLDVLVDQVLAVADAAGAARFNVVGFSMGALVAQRLACLEAKRVTRTVLMSGVYNRSDKERAAVSARLSQAERDGPTFLADAALSRWFSPGFLAQNPSIGETVRGRLMSNDREGFLAAYRLFAEADTDLVGCEAALSSPTLVATGALDVGSTPAMAKTLAAKLPDGRAEIWPGLAHLAPLEAPAVVARTIRDFLETGPREKERRFKSP